MAQYHNSRDAVENLQLLSIEIRDCVSCLVSHAATQSPTTALVVDAPRQGQALTYQDGARGQLIDALCGCVLYSVDLDALAATIKVLSEEVMILRRDGEVIASKFETKH